MRAFIEREPGPPGRNEMQRLAATLCLAAAFLFAPATRIRATGGHPRSSRRPREPARHLGRYRGFHGAARRRSNFLPADLRRRGGGSAPDQAHLHIANPGNNGGIVVFLCSNLGNTPGRREVRECPPSPNPVTGDIVAADVLAVVDGEPPHRDPDHRGRRSRGAEAPDRAGRGTYTPAQQPARSALSSVPIAAAFAPQANAPCAMESRPALSSAPRVGAPPLKPILFHARVGSR